MDGGRGYFLHAYISLKSKPADSARSLAVSNLRERQRVQKQQGQRRRRVKKKKEINIITVNSRKLLSILNR